MIDIPLNKALAAVEWEDDNSGIYTSVKRCSGCFFYKENHMRECLSDFGDKIVSCNANYRKDGKNVIFKLADWPGEKNDN